MRVQVIDTVGLKGHRSALMANLASPGMKMGDILEIWGDCPTFEKELRFWCKIMRKSLLSIEQEALVTKIQIQF